VVSPLYIAEFSASFQHGCGFMRLCILAALRGMGNLHYQVHSVLRHISLIFTSKASEGSFRRLILNLEFDKSAFAGSFHQTNVLSGATSLLATAWQFRHTKIEKLHSKLSPHRNTHVKMQRTATAIGRYSIDVG
jgi:hypothetical protein